MNDNTILIIFIIIIIAVATLNITYGYDESKLIELEELNNKISIHMYNHTYDELYPSEREVVNSYVQNYLSMERNEKLNKLLSQ